ncbi:hypothetical protein [Sphingomonas sp. CCH20-B6]|jgi:hypothetical protein|uniref:hypothetical protein n=2 Tax=Sphingomonas TaxID=13687 RepID=UPI0012E37906|nr:hypothetical protein [Sphingomonas sp. CCH20-B6]
MFWLNSAWLESFDRQIRGPAARADVVSWLMNNYAVQTVEDESAADTGVDAYADRYGATDGAAHGGSGRCVYVNTFNIKGVGRTPLVASGAVNHAHGGFGLIEALRGTVYAELVHRESLHGAVRTLAILTLPPFGTHPTARRCLLIRPNFVRPAHAERSLFFGRSGSVDSDQYQDHLRVQEARRQFVMQGLNSKDVAVRAAQQIGSLDALQMAQGRFTSSNMSVDGQVADFETFRLFNNWNYLSGFREGHHLFGREIDDLVYAASSWSRRWEGKRRPDETLSETVRSAHRDGFIKTLHNIFPTWDSVSRTSQHRASMQIYKDVVVSRRSSGLFCNIFENYDLSASDSVRQAIEIARMAGYEPAQAQVIAGRILYARNRRSAADFRNINWDIAALAAVVDLEPDGVEEWVMQTVSRIRRLHKFSSPWMIPLFRDTDPNRLVVYDVSRRSFGYMRLQEELLSSKISGFHPVSKAEVEKAAQLVNDLTGSDHKAIVLDVLFHELISKANPACIENA